MNPIPIQVGQIWRSGDLAHSHRLLLVETAGATHTGCLCLPTGRRVFIRNDRMRPGSRGYALVTDPEILAQAREQYQLTDPTPPTAPPAEPPVAPVAREPDVAVKEATYKLTSAIVELVALVKSKA